MGEPVDDPRAPRRTKGQRMSTTRVERIGAANEMLRIFHPEARLALKDGRIRVIRDSPPYFHDQPAILSHCGDRLRHTYKLACGGTVSQAIGQLVRWVRGETRLPRDTWEYWCGQTVWLARERGPELLAALDASGYCEADKTCCVLCGNPRIGDWWSLDGVTGPCCGWRSGCRQQRSPQPFAAAATPTPGDRPSQAPTAPKER